MRENHYLKLLMCVVGALTLLTGCGLNFTVKDPVSSNLAYDVSDLAPTVLTIVDQRTGTNVHFLMGQIGAGAKMSEKSLVTLNNVADPIAFFAGHLEKELNSRRIPVQCVTGKSITNGLTLVIHRYQIISIRATSFSPWETMHVFSGTLISGDQKSPIKSFFYNGKVPLWSMNEILEPCFNIPMSVIIKDVASKINRAVFRLRVPDQKVENIAAEINAKIDAKDFTDFWKVLELGYTNNSKAVGPLKKYSQTGDELFRSCAVSSIGTLGMAEELAFLKKAYRDGWYNDRYLALKAMGDLGTDEALAFLATVRNEPVYAKEGGVKHCIDLYLP
ncbi:MAG: HEAT repeat domain-containing protein [Smithellaceae bacterium]